MRFSVNFVAAFALTATVAVAATAPASAECKRYGFSVNDYGKDGPTQDAKDLLDKLIASKMSERGVSDYRTGKKNVSCELFLNFIVFDEHTCTAEATVCWGGSKLPGAEQAAVGDVESGKASPEPASDHKPTKKKTAKEAAKEVTKEAAVQTEAAPVAHKTAAQAIPDPKSLLQKKKSVEKKEAAASAPVETGSLSEAAPKAAKHKPQTDDGSADVAPVREIDNGDSGYPTPQAPADGGGQ